MPENKVPTLNKDRMKATEVGPKVEANTVEDAPVTTEESTVEVETVAEPPVSIKVKYIGGQGIELAYPLSNGLRSFQAGKVYELKNYGDFCRLTEASKHFVEVKDEPAR
jgi:hypothetical protein